jgi:hypothetical protein
MNNPTIFLIASLICSILQQPTVQHFFWFNLGIIGMIVPILIGYLTQEMTFSSWELVFSVAATVYICGNLIYIFAIQGQTQSWNYPKQNLVDAEEDGARQKLNE